MLGLALKALNRLLGSPAAAAPASPSWVSFVNGRKLSFAIVRGDGAVRVCGVQDYTVAPDGDVQLNTAYDADKLGLLARAMAGRLDGQQVLDIGCNTGLFVFQALRWGAARATGWDTRRDCVEVGSTLARVRHEESRARFEFRDFWSEPVACDVVFLFGVVHHLALGGERGLDAVLTQLSEFPARRFCIEWIGVNDLSVKKLTARVGKPLDQVAYSEERFVELGRKLLGDVHRLGRVRHHRYSSEETDRSLFVFSRVEC